ncbi:integrase/recombinase xerD homolog isoform X1 [Argopecten irradians]|uniref:integrase/recombinase xerD homolog isoform X1 n=1 Tax=Argopecten irradians TaxID=31199 RepID=UPI00371A1D0D
MPRGLGIRKRRGPGVALSPPPEKRKGGRRAVPLPKRTETAAGETRRETPRGQLPEVPVVELEEVQVEDGITVGQILPVSSRRRTGATCGAKPSMGNLQLEIETLIQGSLSNNTKQAYSTGLSSFKKFRELYRLSEMWPVPINHLLQYVAYLSISGASPSTTQTYLSGISYHHKIKGWGDPAKQFLVQKVMEGYRRTKASPDVRAPITLDILRKIVGALPFVCTSTYETSLFRVAFLLAFFGFMRVGELTSTANSDHAVGLSDVSLNDQEVTLKLTHSKTDQTGKGHILVISACPDLSLCPVKATSAFLRIRPKSLTREFLCHASGRSLSRYQFSAVLKKTLQFANVPAANFKTHSFRIGAASAASLQGTPDEQIKVLGRWKSACFQRYIRISAPTLLCR